MNLAIQRIRVYFKLILLVALAALIVIVAIKNRRHTATIWFFHTFESIGVVWLLLCTGVAAVICWWLFRSSITVRRDLRSLQQEERRQEQQKENQALSDRLAAAERKLGDRKTPEEEEPVDAE